MINSQTAEYNFNKQKLAPNMNFTGTDYLTQQGQTGTEDDLRLEDYNFNDYNFPASDNSSNLYTVDASNSKNENFLMPASAGSHSEYSSTYGTPNSIDTSLNPSTEMFMSNGANQDFQQQQSRHNIEPIGKGSTTQLQPQSFQQKTNNFFKTMQNNPYFTPALNNRSFHERNRSDVSEFASPTMNSHSSFYENGLSSPIHNSHQNVNGFGIEDTHFDDISNNNFLAQIPEAQESFVSNHADINKFIDMCDFVDLNGKKPAKNEYLKNRDFSKVDLSSLGIGLRPDSSEKDLPKDAADTNLNKQELAVQGAGDISFSINESFINELLAPGDSDIAKDLLKEIETPFLVPHNDERDLLLPAFDDKNSKTDDFLNPNSLNNLRQSAMKNHSQMRKSHAKQQPSIISHQDGLDEGDTTIINSTSIMEMNESRNEEVPNTDNLIDELANNNELNCLNSSSRRNSNAKDLFTPGHSRNNSNATFEMPKLKSFNQKSPKLGSPSRVGKFPTSTSFRSIPTLNEKLAYIDDSSSTSIIANDSILDSPTRGNYNNNFIQGSLPSSPTRDFYLARANEADNSFVVKTQALTASPMYYAGGGHFNGSCIAQTPPASPSKAMSGLSLSSPTRSISSSPTKNSKGSFVLKPTPNGRKRIATAPRSKTGCWTCRIRHKKCDEGRPVCNNCAKINLKCDQYYDPKPSYMTNEEEKKVKLAEIAHIWKNRSKKSTGSKSSSPQKLSDSNKTNSESPDLAKKPINEYVEYGDKENFGALA
ncbi:DNA-binding transcriptional regulator [Saccharomycopsis crataegensis]|uniref:DNA-binding transcriptional regulator n=1 Tax=Saccharomycopsis crataegensis TaxID=43959 RepID=A0AAV5QNK7_9ASCO|nr:DNA-binding transcriptional regulator [Saccharomycopsis crataegensis]